MLVVAVVVRCVGFDSIGRMYRSGRQSSTELYLYSRIDKSKSSDGKMGESRKGNAQFYHA